MSYAILSLVLLALFHFIYESILAPSFRMKLRFELSAQQDQLRCLRKKGLVGAEHARYVGDSLTSLLSMLHRFDAGMLVAVGEEVNRNQALREQVELRTRALDTCGVPEVVELRRRLLEIAVRAVLVNHGAWCIYVVPVAFASFGLDKIKRLIKASTSVSRSDLLRIFPVSEQHAHCLASEKSSPLRLDRWL